MSDSPRSLTTTSVSFRSILDAALDNYSKQTGIDLMGHPSANKFQICNTPEDVLQLLRDRETEFKDYRNKNSKLINCLLPIVKVVHACSGVLSEVAGFVSPGNRPRSRLIISLCFPHQVPFQPTKAIFVSVDILLVVRLSLPSIPHINHPRNLL